jgi:ring-1,2-phenylacetyl-CoA epoxidase subunit PaaB
MIWEVFRQEEPGDYHQHCGNVHAPDAEMAKLFAQIQHGRRKPTHSMWVVPQPEIAEVDEEDTAFGGTTDKSYRWAMTYSGIEAAAQEVADSESEQADAERRRARRRQEGDD